ncbi:MAG TPA: hypothetical protein VFV83_09050 [Chthoniobacteraceae bacterium]|nr:hypothetical protein [Chthoniobacteraceae bacterium]
MINPSGVVPVLELRGPANPTILSGVAGTTLSYHDEASGIVISKVHRHGAEWQWQVATAEGGEQLAMKLSSGASSNVLRLIDPLNPNRSIVIDAAIGITIGSEPVLTRPLADAIYIRSDTTQASLFGGRATASRTIAIGPNDSSALGSTSIGNGNVASAHCATAIGTVTWAAAPWATTLGVYTYASGAVATAMGNGTRAEGTASLATGAQTEAAGDYSSAFGFETMARGFAQVVIGRNNIAQGDAKNWVETDDLFIVGNGSSAAAPSNAMVVKKNGDTVVSGSLTVKGAMHIEPRGGISMGEFTAVTEE